MKPTFNDKLIAYLVLFSGLAISGVAEYYSIMGLMAIYPAAIIPIVIMGVVLGIGKISGTVWLKQNWEWSPFFLKAYVLPAIVVLMLITSLGVFGFLSKAHSDQSLVSGDVQSKIAVYDTKIQTAKDNIDANRKALKQMDEAVDQVMGRSSDEKGADKAVSIRRAQQKERQRLQSEISAEQKTIAALNEERAPIAAEVRKVDAEVGPIKYIAHLLYGENPDANILEKAVIWVTVLIVIVLDPLAVVLLLASQYSFQYFRKVEEDWLDAQADELTEAFNIPFEELQEGDPVVDIVSPDTTVTELETPVPVDQWNNWIAEAEEAIKKEQEETVTPAYEPDDGPLTDEQIEHLRELAEADMPTGELVTTSKLFPNIEYQFGEEIHEDDIIDVLIEPDDDYLTDKEIQEIVASVAEQYAEPIESESEITIDYTTLPEGTEYIRVNGENMHLRAAQARYKQTYIAKVRPEGYIQNEEQGQDTKWNRVISEAEYREVLAKKNDIKNNPDNAA
jgi:hypothetical protein